jgi:hypothetical protein
MVRSIINWINSGFQGKPAFVQDLKEHLLNIADETVGDFIYNDPSLNFLCSPFQLDVKASLALSYQESQNFAQEAQCTLSDVTDNVEGFLNGSFAEGGWASWFEVTGNPVNTPGGAYLAGEAEMYARIVDEQGNAVKELDWGNGFLSFKVCSDTDVANGTAKDCDITTPGAAIADQLNRALGAGQDQLITADEINEIISALMAQLAQKALTGMNGLLGLGSTGYTDYSLGSNASSSFLTELQDDALRNNIIDEKEPFSESIEREKEYIDLQTTVLTDIVALEGRLANHNNAFPTCSVTMPSKIDTYADEALIGIEIASTSIAILETMTEQFISAADGEGQLAILADYNALIAAEDALHDVIDIVELEILIEVTLPEDIAQVDQAIATAANRCIIGNN